MKYNNDKKFIFRSFVLIFTFTIAIYDINILQKIVNYDFVYFKFYHLLWLFMILGMVQASIPILNNQVCCGKIFSKHFKENLTPYRKEILQNYTRQSNFGALRAAIFWSFNLIAIGFLYNMKIINNIGIHIIVVFFYFSDQFCVTIWCPFRAWIVRNRCCNTCRIFNWGHFMIVSPYIFIPSFWTYSLVLMSLFSLFQWEYLHYKHPERFFELANLNLQCSHCYKTNCNNNRGTVNKNLQA